MTQTIEFFWDVGSPYTYLASTRINRVAEKHSVPVRWRPFLLGGVFNATGNKPPASVAAKAQYMMANLQMWSAYYNEPLTFPSSFPINSLLPMRAATAADQLGKGPEFGSSIMSAYWGRGEDASQPDIVRTAAAEAGLDPDQVIEMTQDQAVKDTLRDTTDEAVRRGAFGAPTLFIGDDMFWGNDHLILIDAYFAGELASG